MEQSNTTRWDKAILLLDMDAFFASVEQHENPHLRAQPIAITQGDYGGCIITCSYEARQHGIKTGMRLSDAQKLCPNLIACPSRLDLYMDISRTIMTALIDITPDIEVFSVDEAFLDVSSCQGLHGNPMEIAKKAQQKVYDVSGLSCSVGIGGDKTAAKYAAGKHKPGGITCIHPSDSEAVLAPLAVKKLCGIGPGVAEFLAQRGVFICADMKTIPISVLAGRFGNLGRRIWLMCQGKDPAELQCETKAVQSMGHSKILPPNTWKRQEVTQAFHALCEKLAARLRKNKLSAKKFDIGLHTTNKKNIHTKTAMAIPSNDGKIIFDCCLNFLTQSWQPHMRIQQIYVRATDPQSEEQQTDLFNKTDIKRQRLNQVIDKINTKFDSHSNTGPMILRR